MMVIGAAALIPGSLEFAILVGGITLGLILLLLLTVLLGLENTIPLSKKTVICPCGARRLNWLSASIK